MFLAINISINSKKKPLFHRHISPHTTPEIVSWTVDSASIPEDGKL